MAATTGSTLKALRLKRGRTLDDVAKVTRIPKNVLESLEGDRRAGLPASVYLKGFIRLYCQALQHDSREVIDLFEREEFVRAQRAVNDESLSSRNIFFEAPAAREPAPGLRVSHLLLLLVAAITFIAAVLTSSAGADRAEVSQAAPISAPSSDGASGTVSSVAASAQR